MMNIQTSLVSPAVAVRTQVRLTIRHGIEATLTTFHGLPDGQEHVALLFDGAQNNQTAPLVRLHSSCFTGDVLGSHRCDCGDQLEEAIQRLSQDGGVLLYMFQEGRGIGLYNKIDAYRLQIEQGLDTYAANVQSGHKDDARDYAAAAGMLTALDTTRIRLLTNNPAKIAGLRQHDITVESAVPTGTFLHGGNRTYLQAKYEMRGHTLAIEKDKS